MDFQSAMETFAEAWVAANTGKITNSGAVSLQPLLQDDSISIGLSKGVFGGNPNGNLIRSLTPPESSVDYGKVGQSGMDLSPTKRPKSHRKPGDSTEKGSPLGKSMPIHCIIEVNNGGGLFGPRDSGKIETGTGSGGSVTIAGGPAGNVISELQFPGLGLCGKEISGRRDGNSKVVEVDDFVIIPAGTPFQDVVTTVLNLLGYPKDIIHQAEGRISLRNWKPLRLDQVCDSPSKTVGDILNDLTNHATLRVLVTRAKGGTADDLKEKLLRLLLAQSSSLLMGAGCPLDEGTLTQLVKGHWPANLAEDVKRRFDHWYAQHASSALVESLHHHQHFNHGSKMDEPRDRGMPPNMQQMNHPHIQNGAPQHPLHLHHDLSLAGKAQYDEDQNHPVFQSLTTQKTRMRTSFDPEMELPKLQHWFQENPHPSRHQIQQYVRELNILDCRKDRKPLDVNNVIYWFKNARAAQKRNELRYNGLSPHQSFPHSIQHQSLAQSHPLNCEGPHSHASPRMNNHHRFSISRSRSRSPSISPHTFPDSHQDSNKRRRIENDLSAGTSRDSLMVDDNGNETEKDLPNPLKPDNDNDEDIISVDAESTSALKIEIEEHNHQNHEENEGNLNNNEPKDLSAKSPESSSSGLVKKERKDLSPYPDEREKQFKVEGDSYTKKEESYDEGERDGGMSPSTSPSVSPRSSPPLSPSNSHFGGVSDYPGNLASRFQHPFFEHPSFMAYRHFSSFGGGFPPSSQPPSSGPESSSPPSAFETAMSLGRKGSSAAVAAAAAAGLIPFGKPSPPGGLENMFHDFSQRGSEMSVASRMRAEELFHGGRGGNSDLLSSIMGMNAGRGVGLGSLTHGHLVHGHGLHGSPNSLALDERRKRNRTFIDPVTEVPRLEQWFGLNTHPSHNLILKYTEELNRMPYRQKFPKLEPKNVQFWFKNRRAKCKRLKMTLEN